MTNDSSREKDLNKGTPRSGAGARVFVITGERGAGKSVILAGAAAALQYEGFNIGGISAPGLWKDGKREGFDIVDLMTGERAELCRADGPDDWPKVGRFSFRPAGLEFGRKALSPESLKAAAAVGIDEIGPWELDGGGWAPELERLLKEDPRPLVLVIRKELLGEAVRRWGLSPTLIEAFPSDNSAPAAALLAGLRAAIAARKEAGDF